MSRRHRESGFAGSYLVQPEKTLGGTPPVRGSPVIALQSAKKWALAFCSERRVDQGLAPAGPNPAAAWHQEDGPPPPSRV